MVIEVVSGKIQTGTPSFLPESEIGQQQNVMRNRIELNAGFENLASGIH